MIRFDALFAALLIVLGAASALGVASSQHEARRLRSALEREQTRTQNLKVEWERLQIEQSTLAAPRRVASIAHELLGMAPPDAGQIVVLEADWP
ncbi:MAG: cell division protein FtsL [Betaproteobacteria bacterium]|nr:cell division protein FtsL [Betaproteobacteria bacterium]